MKILIATESYYPIISGVAVFSHNLAKMMVQNGHQVYVIAPSPKLKEYQEIHDGVTIFRLRSRPNKFRHHHYNSWMPFSRVKKIIRQVEPDIIHLQDPMMISVAALSEAKRQKIPVIITNHFSLEYIVSYLPWLKPLHFLILFILTHYLNWFYAKANVLTCPTETTAKHFLHTGIKTQVQVISNGVDLSRFMPHYGDSLTARRHFKIPLDCPIILYVGRLDVDKNVNEIILSAPKVLEQTNCHFIIVGSGKEKNSLEKLVEKHNLQKNFTFTDFIAHDSRLLPEIYQTSTLFIDPCPRETQGIVVLEAEATGLPIIGAKGGALVELVKNNLNGFLYEPGNTDQLAEKIITILQNDKQRQKMGDQSLEIVEGHVVEDTFSSFESLYKQHALRQQ